MSPRGKGVFILPLQSVTDHPGECKLPGTLLSAPIAQENSSKEESNYQPLVVRLCKLVREIQVAHYNTA
jgi:hypothetical protein